MGTRSESLVLVGMLVSCGDDGGGGEGGSAGSTSTSAGPTSSPTATDSTDSVDSTDSCGETSCMVDTTAGSEGSTSTGEPGEGCIVHVDASSGSDAFSGLSWAFAKQTLGAGLEFADEYDCDVWIAQGTYRPSEVDPLASFVLFQGAQVYGGFAGDEASIDERDWIAHPTVLSGDIGMAGEIDDNSLHVVIGNDRARLDGVTVIGGYSRDVNEGLDGAGLWLEGGSMEVAHCRFEGNRGGDGVGTIGTVGSPGGGGAGIYFFGDDLSVEDCTFVGNRGGDASEGPAVGGFGGGGGALQFIGGSLRVEGSTFEGNASGLGGVGGDVGGNGGLGGAVYVLGESATIVGSSFVDNVGGAGGQSPNLGGGSGVGAAISVSVEGELVVAGNQFEGNALGPGGRSPSLAGGSGLGGAMFIRSGAGDGLIAHNVFVDNEAGPTLDAGGSGGALAIVPSNMGRSQGNTTVIGNVFAGNRASTGGALWLRSKGVGSLDVVGCSMSNNVATTGGALFYQSLAPESDTSATMVNSVLWGNTAMFDSQVATNTGFIGDPVVALLVDASVMQGGCDLADPALGCGMQILDVDPEFVAPAAGDLHLIPGSMAVDVGDELALPVDWLDLDDDGDVAEPWPLDLDGGPRVSGATIDLGAYEQP